jgi:hypothetical protein|tara:strand:+ start:740 stop:1243 length:504 start_codon:yes stop_codon:yes gene_type:complete
MRKRKMKNRITGTHLGILVIALYFVAQGVMADGIVFKFKSPSFSGQGTSAHYLTIENQEKSRQEKIQEDVEAAIEKAERDANNTTQAKFLRNLESRIYAQIAKQLVDNMFNNTESSTSGFFEIEGNSITYETIIGGGPDGMDIIRITVISEDGTTTTLDVPIGAGGF